MKIAAQIAAIVCAAFAAACNLSPQPIPPGGFNAATPGGASSGGTSSSGGAGGSGTAGMPAEVDAAGTGMGGTGAPVIAGDAALEQTMGTDGGGLGIADASSDSTGLPADAAFDSPDAEQADVTEEAGDAANSTSD